MTDQVENRAKLALDAIRKTRNGSSLSSDPATRAAGSRRLCSLYAVWFPSPSRSHA